MALPLAKLLISAMAVFMLVSDSFATSELPFMKVHKRATLNRLRSGAQRVFVSYDIYNQGSSTAYDVTLIDNSWDKATFEVVDGNNSKSWERLDAGGVLSHSFELKAKVDGIYYGDPILVTFRIPTMPTLQHVYSIPILCLDVRAWNPLTPYIEKYVPLIIIISTIWFICWVAKFVESDKATKSPPKSDAATESPPKSDTAIESPPKSNAAKARGKKNYKKKK